MIVIRVGQQNLRKVVGTIFAIKSGVISYRVGEFIHSAVLLVILNGEEHLFLNLSPLTQLVVDHYGAAIKPAENH